MDGWIYTKEHSGPPRTCGNGGVHTQGASTAPGLPSCWSTAKQTAWTRPLLPPEASMQRRGGSQLRSLQCSALTHAAIPRLSPREKKRPTAHLRTTDTAAITHFSDVPLQFHVHVSDLRRSFLAVSRSSSSSVTWAERAARRSFIWLCSCDCFSRTS